MQQREDRLCQMTSFTGAADSQLSKLGALAASAWHAHVISEAGGQEHQWFRPSSLVLPVLIFQLAFYCDDVSRSNSGSLANLPRTIAGTIVARKFLPAWPGEAFLF
jgi:hypothetical protein